VAKDPYVILDIPRYATKDEIRAAYLTKMKKYHPDVNEGKGDVRALNEAQEAYAVIAEQSRLMGIDKVRGCKHCDGKGRCSCMSCQFMLVLRNNYFAGQCAVCFSNQ